ncbi:MAG: hypothetical protein A2V98_04650 [Planctomycetes bacterium RBG_16_64_12]|nr:MAG: hypothetical protein A2V98_04650 [Planctomycetes bacterium RBG_16_64_12]
MIALLGIIIVNVGLVAQVQQAADFRAPDVTFQVAVCIPFQGGKLREPSPDRRLEKVLRLARCLRFLGVMLPQPFLQRQTLFRVRSQLMGLVRVALPKEPEPLEGELPGLPVNQLPVGERHRRRGDRQQHRHEQSREGRLAADQRRGLPADPHQGQHARHDADHWDGPQHGMGQRDGRKQRDHQPAHGQPADRAISDHFRVLGVT